MKITKVVKNSLLATSIAMTTGAISTLAFAGSDMDDKHPAGYEQKHMTPEQSQIFKDGWREGKLETALLFNTHLNNFDIDSEVRGDKAILTGFVPSEIELELAEEVALSVDGINDVDNKLEIEPKHTAKGSEENAGFMASIKDASISAEVKIKMLAKDELSGMDIDVDTDAHVVTLTGKVGSGAEKALAEQVARNVDDVVRVENKLTVAGNS